MRPQTKTWVNGSASQIWLFAGMRLHFSIEQEGKIQVVF
jgi:hypothetical protein